MSKRHSASRLQGNRHHRARSAPSSKQERGTPAQSQAANDQALRHPGPETLNSAIPLFFIGRNRHGFWVARDYEGIHGGIFLTKNAALEFAKRASGARGHATTFLRRPIELDIANSGNAVVGALAAARKADRLPGALAKILGPEFLRAFSYLVLMSLFLAGIVALKFAIWMPRF